MIRKFWRLRAPFCRLYHAFRRAATTQYQRLVEVSRLPGINIENSLRATLQLEALGKSGEDVTEIIREFGNALALSGTWHKDPTTGQPSPRRFG